MSQTYHAIFEKGAFHLIDPLGIPLSEGQEVKIVVETLPTPTTMLDLMADVYDGLTPKDIVDIEVMALDRRHFFSERGEAH